MIVWIQLCFYGYAWVMEMWILHLLAGNYVFGEKPLDSYELWKCEHYGSGDKSGFNSSQINCCTWKVLFFYYWDILQLPDLLNKQMVRSNRIHLFYALQLLLVIRHVYFIGPLSNAFVPLSFLPFCVFVNLIKILSSKKSDLGF